MAHEKQDVLVLKLQNDFLPIYLSQLWNGHGLPDKEFAKEVSIDQTTANLVKFFQNIERQMYPSECCDSRIQMTYEDDMRYMHSIFAQNSDYKKYVMNKMFIFQAKDAGIKNEFLKIFQSISLYHVDWSGKYLQNRPQASKVNQC